MPTGKRHTEPFSVGRSVGEASLRASVPQEQGMLVVNGVVRTHAELADIGGTGSDAAQRERMV